MKRGAAQFHLKDFLSLAPGSCRRNGICTTKNNSASPPTATSTAADLNPLRISATSGRSSTLTIAPTRLYRCAPGGMLYWLLAILSRNTFHRAKNLRMTTEMDAIMTNHSLRKLHPKPGERQTPAFAFVAQPSLSRARSPGNSLRNSLRCGRSRLGFLMQGSPFSMAEDRFDIKPTRKRKNTLNT